MALTTINANKDTGASLVVLFLVFAFFASPVFSLDFKGEVGVQGQLFSSEPSHSADHESNLSISADVELYQDFGGDDRSLTFRPFVRIDSQDEERTHADVRELFYLQAVDRWELKIGIGQIFWGVAESRNIVDVVNQIDQVEALTTSAKLGQPMLNLTSINEWGDISVFILPYFRERTFAGVDGRPRLPFQIDTDNVQYESSAKEQHVDFAARYSHYIDEWDFGLSYFKGTSREPLFLLNNQSGRLTPFYHQLSQIGIDIQATLESWLLKMEIAHQQGAQIDNHVEMVTGFEYSFYGVAESDLDIGIISEYLWDERSDSPNNFQNDLLIGLRFALNDEASTEALLGVVSDLDGNGEVLTLEASRRISNNLKFSAEAVFWNGNDNPLRKEDYLQLELGYFF